MADTENPPVGAAVLVFYDAHERADGVVDREKTPPLAPVAYDLNVAAMGTITQELRNHAAAFARIPCSNAMSKDR